MPRPDSETSRGIAALGEWFRSIGYDEAGIEAGLGGLVSQASADARVAGVRRLNARQARDRPTDSITAAIRFWYLGDQMDFGEAAAAVGAASLADLTDAGFARVGGASVTAAVRVVPFQGVLIAHDRDDAVPPPPDHVLGAGGATRTLAALTVRRNGGSFLDVGTGSGAQALLASRRADRVVATDLNPRAVMLARANAELNGIDGLDVREGDLFGPVSAERFDVVVSNPPFVVSPDHAFVFRDAGRRGDAMSRSVVRGAAEHLADGGFATVLVNWISSAATDGATPGPEDWVADLGCDALFLVHEAVEPVEYATRWIVRNRTRAPGAFARTLDRWLRYYERLGIRSITSGAVVLRRRDGRTWAHTVQMRTVPSGNGGAQLERMFAAREQFGWPHDPAIGRTAFRLVDGHRLDQHLTYGDGQYTPHEAVLRLDDNAGVVVHVPADLLELLFALDGSRPLDAVLRQLAKARGEGINALRGRALPVVQAMFEAGYVVASPPQDR